MVTVTRTFTKRVDENFAWKDPKAADKVGMAMMDYVIGGMDRSFKLKLFYTLYAAEQAGLQPGITSAFRDDYRQSIATGLKAATDRSYHGGSLRGGYGRGLAADIVSVKGNSRAQRWVSTEKLWKWIDERGKDFGIGRPYLNRDPPHVAPIDGQEYVSRRGSAKTQEAEATPKKGKQLAARGDRGKAKPAKTAQAKAAKGQNRQGQGCACQVRTGQERQDRKIVEGQDHVAGSRAASAPPSPHMAGSLQACPASARLSSGSIVSILSTASR